jgi:hypothetical protein
MRVVPPDEIWQIIELYVVDYKKEIENEAE